MPVTVVLWALPKLPRLILRPMSWGLPFNPLPYSLLYESHQYCINKKETKAKLEISSS